MNRLVIKPTEVHRVSLRREMRDIVHQRLTVAMLLFLAAALTVALRIAWLAVFAGAPAGATAASGVPSRADITDRNGLVLARTIEAWSIAVHPNRLLGDPDELAPRLAELMPERSADEYRAILNSDRTFVYLRRRALPELVFQVNALGEPAMELMRERERLYPQTSHAAHVLGWVDLDGNGVTGMEAALEEQLTDPARRGRRVALSIDSRVQAAVESELADAAVRFRAIGATGIVLDVHTGELVALASLPDFDPNDPAGASDRARYDMATMGFYELGSTFKLITVAAAMEAGVVKSLGQRYNALAPIRVGGYSIRDDHAQRRFLNVPELLVHSSNIATARIADAMGAGRMQQAFRAVHFDEAIDFELPVAGSPIWPSFWARTTVMTTGFGHGIAVSPLHLANAYATLVNGGLYRPVTLLRRAPGRVPAGERVYSKGTSDHMRGLLRLIVQEGTGRKADAPGYRVGGKTGTAEKPRAGGYQRNALVSTFAAAFPMDDPRYVVVMMFDEPKGDPEAGGGRTAGWTAAPTVRAIIERIGPLLGVMPSDHRDIDNEYLAEMLARRRSQG